MAVSGSDFPQPLPSFPIPVTAPDSDPDDGNQISVCFSEDWLPFVVGALQQLALQATWAGSDSDVLLAQLRAQTLIAMFGAADGGCSASLCIPDVIYDPDTDTVKRSIDGGLSYFDTPDLDPRHSDTFRFPPVTADDPKCQAAANMVRYFSDLIDEVVLVVDTAGAAEGLIAILLPLLLELGPFGILIDLVLGVAFLLFSAGATAISAAFTSGVFDQLLCIFYCNIGVDGTVTAADLSTIQGKIDSDIGGLVATVMDAMLFLMGEVGLTNAGAVGDAPADCSSCDCGWCQEFDFTLTDGGFIADTYGHWESGRGWVSDVVTGSSKAIIISLTFTTADVSHYEMTTCFDVTGTGVGAGRYVDLRNGGSILNSNSGDSVLGCQVQGNDGGWSANKMLANPSGTLSSGDIVITHGLLRGTGTNPFITSNCT